MYVGVQASSTRGVQASPLTARRFRPSRIIKEKRTNNMYDLVNVKLIPTILLDYIPPLAGVVSCNSVTRYFDYTMATAYLLKGTCVVRAQQDKITMLKLNDCNLGYRKKHSMLTLYKYLTMTKGKNSKVIPQPWMMNIVQSTLLNVKKIPYFGRHQEFNACVKILLSCYHGDYLWLDRRIIVNSTLIHRITRLSMQGPDP